MKKITTLFISAALVLTFSNFAFAANAVSEMAIAKGGQHIAECAQKMDKGVSECAKLPECMEMGM